jgi:hypothetical protein
LCTQPPAATDASDERIATINELMELLSGARKRAGNKADIRAEEIDMAELLADLMEQERLYSHIVEAWTWLAVTNKRAGKKWEALKWAHKAQEGALIQEGPASEQMRIMENMIYELAESVGLED